MGRGIRRVNCVHGGVLAASMVAAMAVPVVAQQPGAGATAERRETIIGGAPAAPTFERCVEVQIGSDGAFGCLNQKLRREVDRINPSVNLPPLDARSADVRVGNVNEAAVRQQYGANYGRSAVPYRSPIPTYTLPRR